MKTSISSEAQRNQTSILIRGRENHVTPKPDGQTDRRTDIRTDISVFLSNFASKKSIHSK